MASSAFGTLTAAQSSAGTPVANATVTLNMRDKQTTVALVVGGQFNSGSTLVFEYSTDGVNWISLSLAPSGGGGIFSSVGGANLSLTGLAPIGSQVRVRCTVFASGDSINATLVGDNATDSFLATTLVPRFGANAGVASQPAVAATTVAVPNPYPYDCTVYVIAAGSTITVIKVGTVTTGLITGSFRVPVGRSIALTYSGGTPTWVWIAD